MALGTTNAYVLYRTALLNWRGLIPSQREAVEANLAKAVEINPQFASAHAALAEIRAQLSRSQATIVPHMQKAVALEPSDPWHRLAAARVLWLLRAPEEARKAAESALKLADDDERAQTEAERLLAVYRKSQ